MTEDTVVTENTGEPVKKPRDAGWTVAKIRKETKATLVGMQDRTAKRGSKGLDVVIQGLIMFKLAHAGCVKEAKKEEKVVTDEQTGNTAESTSAQGSG